MKIRIKTKTSKNKQAQTPPAARRDPPDEFQEDIAKMDKRRMADVTGGVFDWALGDEHGERARETIGEPFGDFYTHPWVKFVRNILGGDPYGEKTYGGLRDAALMRGEKDEDGEQERLAVLRDLMYPEDGERPAELTGLSPEHVARGQRALGHHRQYAVESPEEVALVGNLLKSVQDSYGVPIDQAAQILAQHDLMRAGIPLADLPDEIHKLSEIQRLGGGRYI